MVLQIFGAEKSPSAVLTEVPLLSKMDNSNVPDTIQHLVKFVKTFFAGKAAIFFYNDPLLD